MWGLFIIFDVTTFPYPLLFTRQMQWRSIIKSFLEFFVLGFFIYLPKIPPHLLVQVWREEIGPPCLTTASVPRNVKGWLDLSLLRSTLSSNSGKQTVGWLSRWKGHLMYIEEDTKVSEFPGLILDMKQSFKLQINISQQSLASKTVILLQNLILNARTI